MNLEQEIRRTFQQVTTNLSSPTVVEFAVCLEMRLCELAIMGFHITKEQISTLIGRAEEIWGVLVLDMEQNDGILQKSSVGA